MTNTQYLEDYGVRYWRPWQDINGNLGPVYGEQLVNWFDHNTNTHINQIQNIIDTLRTNPTDRRLVASMWNPAEIGKMALPPCHHSLWFYSRQREDGKRVLDTTWHQRSADMPIGIPYNILQYTIVNKIVAMCSGHIPGVVRGVLGNAHYYLDQSEGVQEIISREEEVSKCPKPQLVISERLLEKVWCGEMLELSDFAVDGSDFKVVDYNPLGAIKMPVAV
jgi:thymidylate synthase